MQHKRFRIEEMLARRSASVLPATDSPARKFSSSRETLVQQFTRLLIDGKDRRMARAAGELGAVAEAMEKSTHTILRSAEAIGTRAEKLAEVSESEDASGSAREIQDQLIHIFEACNFQDLAGQRIGKAIETLCRLDGEFSRLLANGSHRGHSQAGLRETVKDGLLNGPRLDGEAGHVSQGDIDALFD